MTIRRWLPSATAGGGTILNVGCGAVPLPGARASWHVINLEVERKKAQRLVLYDGSFFPFRDNSFDGALCLDVVEHVENDSLMLAEVGRVLRPGATLVLTTPATEHDFKEVALPLGKRARQWSEAEAHWGHVRPGYEVGELVCKCREAGLIVVGVEKYGGTIAQALYQLWYLRDLAWLFSKKLVLPWVFMELALSLDHLLFRNRGCAIAIKAVSSESVRRGGVSDPSA